METEFKKPKMYAISTCPRCRRVKQFLKDLGVDYEVVDVDLLPYAEKYEVVASLRQISPRVAFPVIFYEDGVLVGSDIDEVNEVFGGGK